MVMIIEKPCVNIALAQGLLDGRKIHIQSVILHDHRSSLVASETTAFLKRSNFPVAPSAQPCCPVKLQG